ncbi:MAG: plastocyanin/azurin family copper-binding protein [Acidimicrobiales bacterium]
MWKLHLTHRASLVVTLVALVALVALVTVGAACGSVDDQADLADRPSASSTSSSSSAESDDATEEPTFVAVDIDWGDSPTSLPSGTTAVVLRNEGETEHSLVFEGTALRLVAAAGEERSGEVELEAGVLYFFCDIPGHEDAGMHGELTVE